MHISARIQSLFWNIPFLYLSPHNFTKYMLPYIHTPEIEVYYLCIFFNSPLNNSSNCFKVRFYVWLMVYRLSKVEGMTICSFCISHICSFILTEPQRCTRSYLCTHERGYWKFARFILMFCIISLAVTWSVLYLDAVCILKTPQIYL